MTTVSFPELKSSEEDLISFKDGWSKASQCVDAYIDLLEEKFTEVETLKQLMSLKVEHIQHFTTAYDILFNMCIQRDPYNWSSNIYESSVRAIQNYVENKCVPAMDNASSDQHFVWEWTKRWQMIKCFADAMNRIFMYLNRFYIPNSENDKVTARENVFREYREKIYERYQKRVRKIAISSLSRIYSENHPCDCPSPKSLVAQRKRPSTATNNRNSSSLSRALSNRGKTLRSRKFQKRASLPPISSGLHDGTSFRMLTSTPPPRSSGGAHTRRPSGGASSSLQHVRIDEEAGEEQSEFLPHKDVTTEALSKIDPSLAKILSPSSVRRSDESSSSSSDHRMSMGDEGEEDDDNEEFPSSSSPPTKPPISSSEDPFSEEKLEFPSRLPVAPSLSISSTSSLSSYSSLTSSTSSVSSGNSRREPHHLRNDSKSRRRRSSENDELMAVANNSSSSLTTTTKVAKTVTSRRSAPSSTATTVTRSMDLTTKYSDLSPTGKICPQDLCICAKVAFEEIYKGRLFLRDFEPYECQLLLESQMRLVMQTTNLPAEALCGVIISFAFHLRGDPRQQHQSPSSNDSSSSNSRRGAASPSPPPPPYPPPPAGGLPTGAAATPSSSGTGGGASGTAAAALVAVAAAGGNAQYGSSATTNVIDLTDGTPPPLSIHGASSMRSFGARGLDRSDDSSSDPMDTSVTPTAVGGDIMRNMWRHANAVREMLVSADVGPREPTRHRNAHRMCANLSAMHHHSASRAFRRRTRHRDVGPSGASNSMSPSSPSHSIVAEVLTSLRSGSGPRSVSSANYENSVNSMPSLMDNSPTTRSSSSSFEYNDFEEDADEAIIDAEMNALRDFRQQTMADVNSEISQQHRTPSNHAMTPPDLSRPFPVHSPHFPACVDDEGEPFGLLWGVPTPSVGYPLLGAQSTPPPTPAPHGNSPTDEEISADSRSRSNNVVNSSQISDDPFEVPFCAPQHRGGTPSASSSSGSATRNANRSSSSPRSGVSPSLGALSLDDAVGGAGSSSSPPSTSSRFSRRPSSRHSLYTDHRSSFLRASSNSLSSSAAPTTHLSNFSSHDPILHDTGLAHAAPSLPPLSDLPMLHSSCVNLGSQTSSISSGISAPLNIAGGDTGLAMSQLSIAAPLPHQPTLSGNFSGISQSDTHSQMADSPSPPPAPPPVPRRTGIFRSSRGMTRPTANRRSRRQDSQELKHDGFLDVDDVPPLGCSGPRSSAKSESVDDVPFEDENGASFSSSGSGTAGVSPGSHSALSSRSTSSNSGSSSNTNPNLLIGSSMNGSHSMNVIMGGHRRSDFGNGTAASSDFCPCPSVYTSSSSGNSSVPHPSATNTDHTNSPRSSLALSHTLPSSTSSSASSNLSNVSASGSTSSSSSRRRTAADVVDTVDDEDGANAVDGRRVRSRLLSPSAAATPTAPTMTDSTDPSTNSDITSTDGRSGSIDSSSDQDMSPPAALHSDAAHSSASPACRSSTSRPCSRS